MLQRYKSFMYTQQKVVYYILNAFLFLQIIDDRLLMSCSEINCFLLDVIIVIHEYILYNVSRLLNNYLICK